MGFWDTAGRIGMGVATGGLSEVNNYLGNRARRPYDQAASGAHRTGERALGMADDLWGRQMTGLGQATGSYDRSRNRLDTMGNMGPGYGERYWENNQYQFQGPYQGSNNAADYWRQNGGMYGGPSHGEQAWNMTHGQYQDRGRSEMFQANAPSIAQNHAGTMMGWAMGPTGVDKVAGDVRGYTQGADDVNRYAQSQAGALSGPGAYEQWVNADLNGTNPMLEREQGKAFQRINSEMNRRGAFRSGAADTAIGEAAGSFAAQNYQDRANRAQQAQQMQLSRIGQGTQTMGASSQNRLAQGGQMLNLGTAQEGAHANRMGLAQQAQFKASDEAMAGQRLELDAAQAADRARMDRLGGLTSAAQGADRSMFQRGSQGYEQAMGLDRLGLDQDRHGLERLLGGGQLAFGAQDRNWGRQKDILSGELEMGGGLAGLFQRMYGQGGDLMSVMQQFGLNGINNGYGLSAQGGAAAGQIPFQLLSLLLQGGKMMGGGAG